MQEMYTFVANKLEISLQKNDACNKKIRLQVKTVSTFNATKFVITIKHRPRIYTTDMYLFTVLLGHTVCL